MAVLLKYGFNEAGEAIGIRLHISSRARERLKETQVLSRPRRARLALEELGPTFVKLGQLLSTRPDLLPNAYIVELSLLQDQVAPGEFEPLRSEIERQLKGNLHDIFASFDETPIAAGSIAQVHRAVLPNGEQVVVKVRRPDIVKILQTETEILEGLAAILKGITPEEETVDPAQMVREFTEAVTHEVHLGDELRNLQEFGRNFAGDTTVHIPKAYEAYSTDAVLTMEYIDGVKPHGPADLTGAGLEPKVLVHRLADFVLRQIFEFSLFHTDPHPGNLLVLPGNVLAPLDFGQTARLNSFDRFLLGEMVMGIVDQDAQRVVRALTRLDMLSDSTNVRGLTSDFEEMLGMLHSMTIKDIPFGNAIVQTFDIVRRNHVHLPPEFTMMLKCLMTVESVGRLLYPGFNMVELLRPHARRYTLKQVLPSRLWLRGRRMLRDLLELAERMPDDLTVILKRITRGQFQMHVQHEHLENLIHTLDKSSNRISFALVISALVVASSMLVKETNVSVLGLATLQSVGICGYVVAALMGLWLVVSIIRSGRL